MRLRQLIVRATVALLVAMVLFPPAAPAGAQEEAHTTQETTAVSDEQLVEDAYRALLGRAPEDQGKQYWLDRLDSGTTQRGFLHALATSGEHRRYLVGTAFRAYLDRAPEPGAVEWYTGLLARSTTATTVGADLLGSDEYYQRAGGTERAWVDAVYQDVLGRQPEDAGRQYFLDQLASGMPREPLASAILVSPEATQGPELGLRQVAPERQSLVINLDSLEINLDHAVVPEAATVVVTANGDPVPGTVSQGDFEDMLVYEIDDLPDSVQPGERVKLSAVVVAHDGTRVGRADYGFYYQQPLSSLSRGDSGPAVRDLQNTLAQLGYWIGPIDGNYGKLTQQAVYAFQKYEGLERSGVADPTTRDVLDGADRPVPRSTSGHRFEVDKARQLLFLAVDGRAVWVWNTSTGTEEPYTYDGERYIADTPPGRWDVYRQIDGIRESNLGRLYRPKYFHTDGIALHGYPNVPPYPASHGCVRVTDPAIDFIWDQDLMPIGTKVWVY